MARRYTAPGAAYDTSVSGSEESAKEANQGCDWVRCVTRGASVYTQLDARSLFPFSQPVQPVPTPNASESFSTNCLLCDALSVNGRFCSDSALRGFEPSSFHSGRFSPTVIAVLMTLHFMHPRSMLCVSPFPRTARKNSCPARAQEVASFIVLVRRVMSAYDR